MTNINVKYQYLCESQSDHMILDYGMPIRVFYITWQKIEDVLDQVVENIEENPD